MTHYWEWPGESRTGQLWSGWTSSGQRGMRERSNWVHTVAGQSEGWKHKAGLNGISDVQNIVRCVLHGQHKTGLAGNIQRYRIFSEG